MCASGLVKVERLSRGQPATTKHTQEAITFNTVTSRSNLSFLSGPMPSSRSLLLSLCRSKPLADLRARKTSLHCFSSLSSKLSSPRFRLGMLCAVRLGFLCLDSLPQLSQKVDISEPQRNVWWCEKQLITVLTPHYLGADTVRS